jgi:hypothetical protein
VNFDAHMMRHQPHDALGVGRRDAAAAVFEAAGQTVDP